MEKEPQRHLQPQFQQRWRHSPGETVLPPPMDVTRSRRPHREPTREHLGTLQISTGVQRTCRRVNDRVTLSVRRDKIRKPSRNDTAHVSGPAAAWNETSGRMTAGLVSSAPNEAAPAWCRARPSLELSGKSIDGEAPAFTSLCTSVDFHPLVRHHNTAAFTVNTDALVRPE